MKVISMKKGWLGAVALLVVCSQAYAAQDQNGSGNDAQSAQVAAPKASHLPLDHGPRAEITPWVREQRRLRAQQDK